MGAFRQRADGQWRSDAPDRYEPGAQENADLPMLKHPRLFARQHVKQFLQGAAAPRRASRPRSVKNKPKRRS